MDVNLHKKHFFQDINLSLTSLKSEGMSQEYNSQIIINLQIASHICQSFLPQWKNNFRKSSFTIYKEKRFHFLEAHLIVEKQNSPVM